MTELGIYVEPTQTPYHLHEHHQQMCVRRSMYSTLWGHNLWQVQHFCDFPVLCIKSVCTLVWAVPTFPVDTSGVNRFQTSGTLLLRLLLAYAWSRLATCVVVSPPNGPFCFIHADRLIYLPSERGTSWGIRGSTQANTFLCPLLKWLSSDINFLSLLDSVREHCSPADEMHSFNFFPFPGVNTINNSYILTGMVSARSAEVSEILI